MASVEGLVWLVKLCMINQILESYLCIIYLICMSD